MSKEDKKDEKVIGLKIGDQNIDIPMPKDIFLDVETKNIEKKRGN